MHKIIKVNIDMKVKIAVACRYFVKKEVDLPDDVVSKLKSG